MICKDCLHYKVCCDNDLTYDDYVLIKSTDGKCLNFTDRSEWVHLPCKLGDAVYTYESGQVKEWKITFCGKNSRNEYKFISCDDGFKNLFEFWNYDLGKTVFLTRKKAEKALEGMK